MLDGPFEVSVLTSRTVCIFPLTWHILAMSKIWTGWPLSSLIIQILLTVNSMCRPGHTYHIRDMAKLLQEVTTRCLLEIRQLNYPEYLNTSEKMTSRRSHRDLKDSLMFCVGRPNWVLSTPRSEGPFRHVCLNVFAVGVVDQYTKLSS